MGKETKIEWCDKTLNPWRGCSKVSAGCANCYAATFSGRNPKALGVWGPNGTRVVAAESQWREPLKWDKEAARLGVRPRVFCASLADVFEDWKGPMRAANGQELFWPHNSMNAPRWIPDEDCGGGEPAVTMQDVRCRLFELIDATPNLDWLLLTKRPENVANMMPPAVTNIAVMEQMKREGSWRGEQYRPNVWLGTSVENQEAADARIPHLLRVPAAVRFLSCEPLLGELDVSNWITPNCPACPTKACMTGPVRCPELVDWVIVGGESGPGARPFNVEWARSLVRQCKAAGAACFVKQMGASAYEDRAGGDRLRVLFNDKKGGDISDFPADLQVREFPEVKAGAA